MPCVFGGVTGGISGNENSSHLRGVAEVEWRRQYRPADHGRARAGRA